MSTRYITNSENAVRLLEGALLWAKLQNTRPQSLESDEACTAWENWVETIPHSPKGAEFINQTRDLADWAFTKAQLL